MLSKVNETDRVLKRTSGINGKGYNFFKHFLKSDTSRLLHASRVLQIFSWVRFLKKWFTNIDQMTLIKFEQELDGHDLIQSLLLYNQNMIDDTLLAFWNPDSGFNWLFPSRSHLPPRSARPRPWRWRTRRRWSSPPSGSPRPWRTCRPGKTGRKREGSRARFPLFFENNGQTSNER